MDHRRLYFTSFWFIVESICSSFAFAIWRDLKKLFKILISCGSCKNDFIRLTIYHPQRGHSNILDPPPLCSVTPSPHTPIHTRTRETWDLNLSKKTLFKTTQKYKALFFKKCHVTLWLTPSPCYIWLHCPAALPTPPECHVLFAWAKTKNEPVTQFNFEKLGTNKVCTGSNLVNKV